MSNRVQLDNLDQIRKDEIDKLNSLELKDKSDSLLISLLKTQEDEIKIRKKFLNLIQTALLTTELKRVDAQHVSNFLGAVYENVNSEDISLYEEHDLTELKYIVSKEFKNRQKVSA